MRSTMRTSAARDSSGIRRAVAPDQLCCSFVVFSIHMSILLSVKTKSMSTTMRTMRSEQARDDVRRRRASAAGRHPDDAVTDAEEIGLGGRSHEDGGAGGSHRSEPRGELEPLWLLKAVERIVKEQHAR